MSYELVETGLADVIKLLARYDNTNVSRGDARIFANAKRENVILDPGSIPVREVVATPRRVREVYQIQATLYIRFKTEISEIWQQIRTVRQELLDHLDKYPTLNGVTGVITSWVSRANEPIAGAGPMGNMWTQTFIVDIEERKTVTIAE